MLKAAAKSHLSNGREKKMYIKSSKFQKGMKKMTWNYYKTLHPHNLMSLWQDINDFLVLLLQIKTHFGIIIIMFSVLCLLKVVGVL